MHLPCRTALHCCSSLGKGKGDSEEEHTEAAVARLPWILPSARVAIATDQPAQQGMLLEESRLSPLRPRSQFVFLAACGTRPCCSRWRAASTRTLELLRYLAASKRPAAPHMIMGHAGAVAAVQLKKAQILGLALEDLCSRGRRSTFAADPTDKEVRATPRPSGPSPVSRRSCPQSQTETADTVRGAADPIPFHAFRRARRAPAAGKAAPAACRTCTTFR